MTDKPERCPHCKSSDPKVRNYIEIPYGLSAGPCTNEKFHGHSAEKPVASPKFPFDPYDKSDKEKAQAVLDGLGIKYPIKHTKKCLESGEETCNCGAVEAYAAKLKEAPGPAAFVDCCKRLGYRTDNGVVREFFNAGYEDGKTNSKDTPGPAAPTSTPPDTRNIEAELLHELLNVLATELNCGPNAYEIRQEIARLREELKFEMLLRNGADERYEHLTTAHDRMHEHMKEIGNTVCEFCAALAESEEEKGQ